MSSNRIDLLGELSADEVNQVSAFGSSVTLAAGDVLFDLGDPADRIFNVVRGRVALTLPMQLRGSEQDVLVEERVAGETVGWSGLIPPHRFTLKASARVDSELIAFPRDVLLEYFASNPSVAFTVTRNVATVIGHRLQVLQTMWLREMQRVVELRYS